MPQTWIPSTLATQLIGELNVARNATGGTVPDRLMNIIVESFNSLWECHDWIFRRRSGTLTFVSGTATDNMPNDFEKLCPYWVGENNREGTLRFTDDEQEFERHRYNNQTTSGTADTGTPHIAIIRANTTFTSLSYAMLAYVVPTPEKALTYPFWYIRSSPDLRHAITGANAGTNTFTIPGDHTETFVDTVTFTVTGSTGNDGSYTLTTDSTYAALATTLTVASVATSDADGVIEHHYMPIWPSRFHRLWHDRAYARALRAFKTGDAWQEAWAHHRADLEAAKNQNDETIQEQSQESKDAYGDLQATTSAWFGAGDWT